MSESLLMRLFPSATTFYSIQPSRHQILIEHPLSAGHWAQMDNEPCPPGAVCVCVPVSTSYSLEAVDTLGSTRGGVKDAKQLTVSWEMNVGYEAGPM